MFLIVLSLYLLSAANLNSMLPFRHQNPELEKAIDTMVIRECAKGISPNAAIEEIIRHIDLMTIVFSPRVHKHR